MSKLLMTIDEAAQHLGVPKAGLKTAARAHGFLVQMGRAQRLERDRLGELIEKCRDHPKERDSISSSIARTGTSPIPASPTAQRAAQAAQRLKKPSQPTSPPKGGKVLPMSRKT